MVKKKVLQHCVYNLSEVNRITGAAVAVVKRCTRCGKDDHFSKDLQCPARQVDCYKCGLAGHFSSCCRTRGSGQYRRHNQGGNPQKRKGNDLHQRSDYDGKRSRYQNVRAIAEFKEEGNSPADFIYNIGDGDEILWVSIGGIHMQILIDSGCQKNIIDDNSWENMLNQGVQAENRRTDSDQRFKAYGQSSSSLSVKEVFEAMIEVQDWNKSVRQKATFYVVEGGTQPLLGRSTAKALGVLTLGLPSTQTPEISRLYTEQKRPFPKMKGIKLCISIDKSISPVCQHARRPPLALMDKIEEKLNSLLMSDIIERVEEYSQWVSPLVTIVKDNGDLRLCVDMRRANQAIHRESHLMPTFEDFLPRLKKARIFSRLDVKDAFHQVELDESCRYITTFITHKGVFRYKRLLFGISCASEMYQKILEQLLSGCTNVVNYIDDILVFGEDEEDHDRALKMVMNTLKSKNVLLNHKKCVYRVPEVVFLGHHISADGIRPAQDKTDAIQSFRAPKTAEELRSFLGAF